MAKILRQSRLQSSLKKDNIQYLKYALGELFLLVAGILIALQVNNWNEERKNRALEKEILVNLHQDFERTLSNLEQSREYLPIMMGILEAKINYIGLTEEQLTPGIKDTLISTGYWPTIFVDGGLNALLQSNKLELISNKKLKNSLTQYPSFVAQCKEDENTLKKVVLTVVRPVVESHISLTDLITADDKFPLLKERAFHSDYSGLLRDPKFQNAIVNQRWHLLTLKNTIRKMLEETQTVLNLIDNEIR